LKFFLAVDAVLQGRSVKLGSSDKNNLLLSNRSGLSKSPPLPMSNFKPMPKNFDTVHIRNERRSGLWVKSYYLNRANFVKLFWDLKLSLRIATNGQGLACCGGI
jgi:hypothetical protein